MEALPTARFKLGKLVSKHHIIEVLSYSHYQEDASFTLYTVNRSLRALLIENHKLIEKFDSCIVYDSFNLNELQQLYLDDEKNSIRGPIITNRG